MDEHEQCKEEIRDLEEMVNKYHGFTIKVAQILTSPRLDRISQRNAISLTYAKMVWPDLWDSCQEEELKKLEYRI